MGRKPIEDAYRPNTRQLSAVIPVGFCSKEEETAIHRRRSVGKARKVVRKPVSGTRKAHPCFARNDRFRVIRMLSYSSVLIYSI